MARATDWPVLAPEEGEFREPQRLAGLWGGAGSAEAWPLPFYQVGAAGPEKCGPGSLLTGPGLRCRLSPRIAGWTGASLTEVSRSRANRTSPRCRKLSATGRQSGAPLLPARRSSLPTGASWESASLRYSESRTFPSLPLPQPLAPAPLRPKLAPSSSSSRCTLGPKGTQRRLPPASSFRLPRVWPCGTGGPRRKPLARPPPDLQSPEAWLTPAKAFWDDPRPCEYTFWRAPWGPVRGVAECFAVTKCPRKGSS